LATGEAWGSTLDFSFTTLAFKLVSSGWAYSGAVFPPSYAGRLVTLSFNVDVDPSTVAAAISTVPPLDLVAERSPYPFNYVEVSVSGGLVAGTHYELHIDDTLLDVTGTPLAGAQPLEFTIESLRVTSASFSSGPYSSEVIEPGSNLYARVTLNATVDVDAFNAAVSFAPAIAGQWSRLPGDPRVMDFHPEALVLQAGQSYAFRISGTAPLAGGATLGSDWVSGFQVEPLRVTSASFSSSPYSSGVIEPGNNLYARVTLNAAVDVDAFNAAASFAPPLAGQWIQSPGDPRVMDFFPETLVLQPGQSYAFRIPGTAPLMGGATLGSDWVSGFQVEPLRLRYMNPPNGSRDVYVWTSIEIQFNAPMDRASVQSAFRLESAGGAAVPGTFHWSDDRGFSFSPLSQLASATTHKILIAGTARSSSGTELGTNISSLFRTY
jgi:hypothetical protein